MAQPRVTVDQVRHHLDAAEQNRNNTTVVDLQLGQAVVLSLMLVAQELDQIGDILAYRAGLKTGDEISIT